MNYDVVLNANDSTILETQYAFTQGDYGQIQFSIRVKADGQYITDATRAYILFTLSNGMIVTGEDMPKNVATYTYVFQGNELQSPGKVVADVKLVYPNGQISSNKFTFMCRFDSLADKSVPAAPYITVLQQIVDEGQEKIDYLQALIDSIQGSIGSTALTRNDLVNNGLTTVAGFALDARYGKTLKDLIDTANSNLTQFGKYDELLRRTSNDASGVAITVSNLTQYRYVLIAGILISNNRIYDTILVPTALFKLQIFNLIYPLDTSEFSYVAYISDTQINVRNEGAAHGTVIYGIK